MVFQKNSILGGTIAPLNVRKYGT